MKLLALPLLVLTLAGCSTTTTSAPYDASGTWQLEGKSATQTSWTGGTILHLTQASDGSLTGTATSTDGSINNTVTGQVSTGQLTLHGGGELFEMTGTFKGNSYAGTYTYGVYDSGSVRMTR
ncbi:hypothetical protein E7T09_18165 [Deinococcus sp. KSM4-11]|uniref:hypothetical protein n=1 Tax=Deinococcus sp. KSM4-11 TaxID=2568654 RepID=UPI0010A52C9E|nr:hypothetical protein [Deinococcus sp. KSM4-11]THF84972.1 hypothetical protein E7T09_18165 [Deinococcus sp. KSM4-11]